MTPLKSIRARCRDCQERAADIPGCVFDGTRDSYCDLWPYRLGRNPMRAGMGRHDGLFAPKCPTHGSDSAAEPEERSKTPSRATERKNAAHEAVRTATLAHPGGPMAAIRRYCLWCCCDSAAEVRLCPSTDCSLHPFRFGRRPRPADKAPVPQLTAAERQGRDQQQAAHQWRLHQAQQLIDLADGAEVEQ